mmetsp:Transcript_69843/g.195280  ORF Transcript_69843/g.195280 Transcript_69843/m.195280 type:complete len:436 (-) Transcript_69843:66-1373(-)
MVKTVGKYQIGKTLGEGTFGKVKFAINTETGDSVAIKVLDKEKIQKQSMGAQIKKEISIMKVVHHSAIVKLTEVLASRTKIFIVLELVTGGELFDKIVSAGRLTEDQARFYFRQLVDGVEYCHSKGVCHRDLKPENLLLDEHGNLKISDFGLSALYDGEGPDGSSRSQLLHTTCGTPNYVAPEVLADMGYDGRTADVWSIGVILYVLLAGFLPFDEPTMTALFRKIQQADFAYPKWFSPEVKLLLDKILVADPAVRVNLKTVKDDEWYLAGGGELHVGHAEDENGNPIEEAGAGAAEGDAENAIADAETTGEEADGGAAADGGEGKSAEAASTPKRLNAFDLINQCGGVALNRMLLTQVKGALLTSSGMIGIIIQSYALSEDVHLVEIRRGKGDILEYFKLYNELVSNRLQGLVNIPASVAEAAAAAAGGAAEAK